jgi:hypothetical protein
MWAELVVIGQDSQYNGNFVAAIVVSRNLACLCLGMGELQDFGKMSLTENGISGA